jgi:hypothetical protein
LTEGQELTPEEVQERLGDIFIPAISQRARHVRDSGMRFAHYTSAESAMKILSTEQMLLRNSTLMNDFSEVQYGLHCLSLAYNSPLGDRLKAQIEKVQGDLPQIFEQQFNAMEIDLRTETSLISISEHGDRQTGDGPEDRFGRLSMWRAYAPKDGVAFVFNNGPFMSETNAINAYSAPVQYVTEDEFKEAFTKLVEGVEANIDLIAKYGGQHLYEWLTHAFTLIVQSTKHPSFSEEREWRVLYSPALLFRNGALDDNQLARIPTQIMTLGGVPQRVFAIPFRNYPDEGFVGATIPELVDRVLIGPSANSYAIYQAMVSELQRLGVADASERVYVTGIPLRT